MDTNTTLMDKPQTESSYSVLSSEEEIAWRRNNEAEIRALIESWQPVMKEMRRRIEVAVASVTHGEMAEQTTAAIKSCCSDEVLNSMLDRAKEISAQRRSHRLSRIVFH